MRSLWQSVSIKIQQCQVLQRLCGKRSAQAKGRSRQKEEVGCRKVEVEKTCNIKAFSTQNTRGKALPTYRERNRSLFSTYDEACK